MRRLISVPVMVAAVWLALGCRSQAAKSRIISGRIREYEEMEYFTVDYVRLMPIPDTLPERLIPWSEKERQTHRRRCRIMYAALEDELRPFLFTEKDYLLPPGARTEKIRRATRWMLVTRKFMVYEGDAPEYWAELEMALEDYEGRVAWRGRVVARHRRGVDETMRMVEEALAADLAAQIRERLPIREAIRMRAVH